MAKYRDEKAESSVFTGQQKHRYRLSSDKKMNEPKRQAPCLTEEETSTRRSKPAGLVF
jgi:hypothetical protein